MCIISTNKSSDIFFFEQKELKLLLNTALFIGIKEEEGIVRGADSFGESTSHRAAEWREKEPKIKIYGNDNRD